MVEGVLVTDPEGRILLHNQSCEEIFKFKGPIVSRSITEVLRNVRLQRACQHVLENGKGMVLTIETTHPTKKHLQAHIEVLGVQSDSSGLVIVFHDVTQIRHLEQVRRDFVANVSHELRTPLTAIKGYTETLLHGSSHESSKTRDFLGTIVRQSDRMSQLVEDLLILAKLESFEAEDQPIEMDVKGLLLDVVDGFKSARPNDGLEIIVKIDDDLPAVLGRPNEIETVLQNLIDNAIKYGKQGKEIHLSALELDDAVRISVTDKGIGIPVDDQPRIFERFYRVDKGRSRGLGGTGLGLSIVKHIVQRHKGRIWVESEVGKGSTFNFTIPKVRKDPDSPV
jgi:two-component system phosphate regulon sensor histidine kinase PhoR